MQVMGPFFMPIFDNFVTHNGKSKRIFVEDADSILTDATDSVELDKARLVTKKVLESAIY